MCVVIIDLDFHFIIIVEVIVVEVVVIEVVVIEVIIKVVVVKVVVQVIIAKVVAQRTVDSISEDLCGLGEQLVCLINDLEVAALYGLVGLGKGIPN